LLGLGSSRRSPPWGSGRCSSSVLGATFLIEESDDLVAAAARVARGRGTTYIMVGESLSRHGVARLREPLPQRLMNATPHGVDVRIVSHRGLKEEA
jgi:two-component system, OmpR family, sensor histidine kinase KdpD